MSREREQFAMLYGAPLVVESIHHDARIISIHSAFVETVWQICAFIHHGLHTDYLWLSAILSWYDLCIDALVICHEDVQQRIDAVYKESIQCYYQAYKTALNGASLLKTMIRSNLAEMVAQYGHYLYKNERYKDALKYYTQAITLVPSHLSALTQQGMCFAKNGEYTMARRSFESILKVTDRFKEIAYAMLNIAWTFRLEKNTQQALEYIRNAKQLLPNDVDVINEENNIVALVSSQAYLSSLNKGRLVFNPKGGSAEERLDEWVVQMDALLPP